MPTRSHFYRHAGPMKYTSAVCSVRVLHAREIPRANPKKLSLSHSSFSLTVFDSLIFFFFFVRSFGSNRFASFPPLSILDNRHRPQGHALSLRPALTTLRRRPKASVRSGEREGDAQKSAASRELSERNYQQRAPSLQQLRLKFAAAP